MDVRRRILEKAKGDEDMGDWETIREFSEIGTDTNKLSILSSNPKGYKEIYFVFYGRENNADDTLSNGNGDNNITVNNVRVIIKTLIYIRGKGTYYFTFGKIELVNDFIFGQATLDNGNGGNIIMNLKPLEAKDINNISMVSNNLVKADSKLAVYGRQKKGGGVDSSLEDNY